MRDGPVEGMDSGLFFLIGGSSSDEVHHSATLNANMAVGFQVKCISFRPVKKSVKGCSIWLIETASRQEVKCDEVSVGNVKGSREDRQ